MPMKLVALTFGELKAGAKFMANVPGKKKRVKLVKKGDQHAALADGSSTLWHQFGKGDPVLAWRWAVY